MGICFLLEDFYPVTHGATTQIMLLGERLSDLDVQVKVITRQIAPDHPRYETINGIEIIRVKPAVGLSRVGKYLMIVPSFFAMTRERNHYELIVVCDLKVLGVLGVLGGKLLGKQCLLRAESCGEMDGTFVTQYGNPAFGLRKFLLKQLIRLRNNFLMKSDGFLSISSAITTEFREAGIPPSAVIEITNGVDTRRFAPVGPKTKMLLKKKLGLSNKRYFLYTGRLTKGKGLEQLLRVWRRLVSMSQEIHLLLLGSGQGYSLSCEDELRRFVKNNHLDKTVTFVGNVNNVEEYLQAGNFFIFPSQSEGLGLSLIEALACGLPCVATNVGGILDIIDHDVNGLLVPYGDEGELLKAMKELLEDEERAIRLGREGRKRILENFNMDNIAQQYLLLSENGLRSDAGVDVIMGK